MRRLKWLQLVLLLSATDKGTTDEIQEVSVGDLVTTAPSKTYAIGNGTNTISVTVDASGGNDCPSENSVNH